MKRRSVNDVRKYLRYNRDGLRIIKSILVGIPYAKVFLDVTIRKELQLSFFYETIMKLLEEDWGNYDEIRNLIGLDYDYFDNILLELGKSDYINHLGHQLTLTQKGKKELEDLKSTRIESDVINNLYINLIDGSMILDQDTTNFLRSAKSNVNLNDVIEVDMDFLIGVEDKIRDLYADNQKRLDSYKLSYDLTIVNELYRIVGIDGFETYYREEAVNIYLSEDNQSFVYIFDANDSSLSDKYARFLVEQSKNDLNSLDRLYDTRYYHQTFKKYVMECCPKNSENLIEERKKAECFIEQYTAKDTDGQGFEFDKWISSDRSMFFREYREFIFELKNAGANEVYFIGDRFFDLTGDSNILSIIGSLLNKSKVYVGYLGHNNVFIQKLKNDYGNNRNLVLKEFDEIDSMSIIVEDKYVIDIFFKPRWVERNVLIEEIPIITFDREKIRKRVEDIRVKFTCLDGSREEENEK